MNREILFRGKRVDTGEWAYGCYVNCSGPGCQPYETRHYIVEYPNAWHEFYTATRGEYTGLKDRNGKRIFEGDIVEYVRVGWDDPEMTRAEVIWCDFDGGWGSTEGQDYWSDALTATDAERMTVIGNIHDNPELLNGETTTRNGG